MMWCHHKLKEKLVVFPVYHLFQRSAFLGLHRFQILCHGRKIDFAYLCLRKPIFCVFLLVLETFPNLLALERMGCWRLRRQWVVVLLIEQAWYRCREVITSGALGVSARIFRHINPPVLQRQLWSLRLVESLIAGWVLTINDLLPLALLIKVNALWSLANRIILWANDGGDLFCVPLVLPLWFDAGYLAELFVDTDCVAESLGFVWLVIVAVGVLGVMACVEAICFHLLAKLLFAAQFVLQSWFLCEVAYWFISAVFMVDALLLACGVGLYFLVEHAFLPFHLFHANSLELVLEIFWDGYGVFLALWWSDYGRPRNGGQHLKSPLHLRESLTFGSVCHLAILWMVVADWRMPLVIFRCHYQVSVLPRHLVAKTEFLARTTVLVLVANPGPIYSRMPLRWILHIHVAQLASRALARAFSASK